MKWVIFILVLVIISYLLLFTDTRTGYVVNKWIVPEHTEKRLIMMGKTPMTNNVTVPTCYMIKIGDGKGFWYKESDIEIIPELYCTIKLGDSITIK